MKRLVSGLALAATIAACSTAPSEELIKSVHERRELTQELYETVQEPFIFEEERQQRASQLTFREGATTTALPRMVWTPKKFDMSLDSLELLGEELQRIQTVLGQGGEEATERLSQIYERSGWSEVLTMVSERSSIPVSRQSSVLLDMIEMQLSSRSRGQRHHELDKLSLYLARVEVSENTRPPRRDVTTVIDTAYSRRLVDSQTQSLLGVTIDQVLDSIVSGPEHGILLDSLSAAGAYMYRGNFASVLESDVLSLTHTIAHELGHSLVGQTYIRAVRRNLDSLSLDLDSLLYGPIPETKEGLVAYGNSLLDAWTPMQAAMDDMSVYNIIDELAAEAYAYAVVRRVFDEDVYTAWFNSERFSRLSLPSLPHAAATGALHDLLEDGLLPIEVFRGLVEMDPVIWADAEHASSRWADELYFSPLAISDAVSIALSDFEHFLPPQEPRAVDYELFEHLLTEYVSRATPHPRLNKDF